jgi:hypothetical protein
MDTEVVLVTGGGAAWTRASEQGEEPEIWHGLGVAGPLTISIHRLAAEPELSEFAQACLVCEKTGFEVVLADSYRRMVAWLNAGGAGWPPRQWEPGDSVNAYVQ